MFWIGMTIVQIYEPRVFTAGIALLETIITVLDSNDAFKGTFFDLRKRNIGRNAKNRKKRREG
jgi:hypothetical protein